MVLVIVASVAGVLLGWGGADLLNARPGRDEVRGSYQSDVLVGTDGEPGDLLHGGPHTPGSAGDRCLADEDDVPVACEAR